MAFLQGFCLVLVATLYGVCEAQCVIRMPMAVMECSSGSSSCDDSSSSADDIGAILLLARALEMDRANNANNGIDVNGLLNTLIHALVYTATHDNGGGTFNPAPSSMAGMSSAGNTGSSAPSSAPTGGSGASGASKNSGGGLPATLKGVTGTVSGLLGGGEGGSGVTGLLDGVANTVEGLLGGDGGGSGSGGSGGGLLGGSGGSGGGLLGGSGAGGLLGL